MFFTATDDAADARPNKNQNQKPAVVKRSATQRSARVISERGTTPTSKSASPSPNASGGKRASLQWTESSLVANDVAAAEMVGDNEGDDQNASGFRTPKSTDDADNQRKSPNVIAEVLLAAAERQQTDPRRAREQMGSPRLNVFTTLPRNFTRFVMKVGPLAAFQDKVEALLLWDKPAGAFLFI